MNSRHTFRADWHDYNVGLYFVTICAKERMNLFGEIYNNTMHLNAIGKVVANDIDNIEKHLPNVTVIKSVVMPNHIHMVVSITRNSECNSAQPIGCLKPPKHDGFECKDYHYNSSLAVVIRSFKAGCSRKIGKNIWQRNFHEYIIRSQKGYNLIINYIELNVYNWHRDCLYKQ